MTHEPVWFMGPINGPGFYLLMSDAPNKSRRPKSSNPTDSHRPPNFAWKSMDRKWHYANMPQGYTAMNWRLDWSVLSVTDYTQDKRPNVMVSFAVERPRVLEDEMRALAEERYPSIWSRLDVREDFWTPEELHIPSVEVARRMLMEAR